MKITIVNEKNNILPLNDDILTKSNFRSINMITNISPLENTPSKSTFNNKVIDVIKQFTPAAILKSVDPNELTQAKRIKLAPILESNNQTQTINKGKNPNSINSLTYYNNEKSNLRNIYGPIVNEEAPSNGMGYMSSCNSKRTIPKRSDIYKLRNSDNQTPAESATICYSLPEDLKERWSRGNLRKILSDEFSIQNINGEIRDNRLYVYPNSQEDFEKITTDTINSLSKCNRKTIPYKGDTLIVSKLTFRELNSNPMLQEKFKNWGITSWSPLVENKWDYRGVKCKCRKRGSLAEIMRTYYLEGTKL